MMVPISFVACVIMMINLVSSAPCYQSDSFLEWAKKINCHDLQIKEVPRFMDGDDVHCFKGDLYDMDCTGNCGNNVTCNGNHDYCSEYPCGTSPCYCKLLELVSQKTYTCGGYMFTGEIKNLTVCNEPSEFVRTTKVTLDDAVSMSQVAGEIHLKFNIKPCLLRLHWLIVNGTSFVRRTTFHRMDQEEIKIALDGSERKVWGENSTLVIVDKSVRIICDDCNFELKTVLLWSAMILGFVILLISCPWILWACLKAARFMKPKVSLRVETGDMKNVELEEMTSEERDFYSLHGRRPLVPKNRAYFIFPLLMFPMLLPSSKAMGCDAFVKSYVENPTCIRVAPDMVNCTVMPLIAANIPTTGSALCLDISDPSGKSLVNMRMQITSAETWTYLKREYYTSDWEPKNVGHVSCPGSTCCAIWEMYTNCQDWESAEIKSNNPCGLFDSNIGNQGSTGCITAGTTGCGLGGDGCFWYRTATQPVGGNGFTIYSATTMLDYYFMDIYHELDSRYPEGRTRSINNLGTYRFMGEEIDFEVFPMGIFKDYALIFDKNILHAGDGSYWVDASRANEPVAGSIGDIQSNYPYMDTYLSAPSLTTVKAGKHDVIFTNSEAGYKRRNHYSKFPTAINGFQSEVVESYDTDPPTLSHMITHIDRQLYAEVLIEFYKPIKYSITQDVVCPEIVLEKVEGCYSCGPGANMTLRTKSTCMSGFCTITNSSQELGLTSNVIPFSTTETKHVLNFLSPMKELDSIITFRCSGIMYTFHLFGNLTEFETVFDKPKNEEHSKGGNDNDNLWDKLRNFLNDKFDLDGIMGTIVTILIILAAVVALILLFALMTKILVVLLGMMGKKATFKGAISKITGWASLKDKGYKRI